VTVFEVLRIFRDACADCGIVVRDHLALTLPEEIEVWLRRPDKAIARLYVDYDVIERAIIWENYAALSMLVKMVHRQLRRECARLERHGR